MCKKNYSKLLLLACAALLEWTTSASASGPSDPKSLGYRRVAQNDEIVIALLAQRVLQGRAQRDPSLYQNLLAEGYRDEAFTHSASKGFADASATQIDLEKQEAVYRIAPPNGDAQLRFIKRGERWLLASSTGLAQIVHAPAATTLQKTSGASSSLLNASASAANYSFINKEIAPEHNLGTLSRQITQTRLQRKLFGLPHSMALFAKVQQFHTAPFIAASYVQLVTDHSWNRIVYGDYQRWIKAYEGRDSGTPLKRPQGIAVDAQGRVYVADTDNGRVLVLQLAGAPENLSLVFMKELGRGELSQPSALAWDDGGTIFDNSDDVLWVIDRGPAALLAYRINDAQRVVKYQSEELIDPVALALGRFDGRSDGNLYLADAATRKLLRFYFGGEGLRPLNSIAGNEEMVPTALATDHWGNVYLSDEAYRQIQKFSPSLELLTTLRPEDESFRPLQFQTLFGTLELANATQPQWSGYDQAFLLEHWTDNSGGRRYALGMDFELEQLGLSADLSALSLAGKLTDPGYLKTELINAQTKSAANALHEGYANAGTVSLQYDRRKPSGEMIAPGYYKLRHTLRSTYDKPEAVRESEAFYLPLYYYEDSGAEAAYDAHLTRGARVHRFGNAPEQTLATDAHEVVYRFAGLHPNVRYEARATYRSAEGTLEQAWFADEMALHAARAVDGHAQTTEWLEIPATVIADGNLSLRFVKTSGNGPASVAEVWLREAHFDAAHLPTLEESAALPQAFTLQQNYPNPFNPSTTITFTLPQDFRGAVTLRVYNMLGELVRELVQRDLSAGTYREVWDGLDANGRRLASGVYLYQLRAGSFAATKKLVLMR